MDKFTVEEINLMCVFEGQDRTGMIADIKNVLPHIQDSDMGGACRTGLGETGSHERCGICRGGIGSGGVIDANLL